MVKIFSMNFFSLLSSNQKVHCAGLIGTFVVHVEESHACADMQMNY